jgi:hypothetical protein
MKDDAIAPVVAVMMILVVVVTLFGIWNAIYLPGFKQQAEVEHLKDVEVSFHKIDENIRSMIVLRRTGAMTETIPLGGGDLIIHQARSGGNLTIGPEELVITVSIDTYHINSYIIPITYSPVSNFWQDQGYEWRYGIVNVTKGTVSTPRFYGNYSDAMNESFTGMVSNESNEIFLANIIAGTPSSASGNGIAQVRIEGGLGVVLVPTPEDPVYLTVDTSTEFGKKVNESVYQLLSDKWNDENQYNITGMNVTLYNLTLSVR